MARTIATIPARIAAGNSGQAVTIAARSGSSLSCWSPPPTNLVQTVVQSRVSSDASADPVTGSDWLLPARHAGGRRFKSSIAKSEIIAI
jgi:hypothetical protein